MIPNLTWDGLGNSWDSLTSDPDAQWNLATLSVPDYLKFGVNEASSLIQSFSTRLDALRVSLGESAIDSFLQSTRQDALRVQLLEAAAIAGVVEAGDTLRVGVSEIALELFSRSDVQDALRIALQEATDIAVDLDVLDSLGIRLQESFRLYSETSTADALLVRVGELAAMIVIMGSDSDFPFGKDAITVAIINEDGVRCNDDWPNQNPGLNVWDRATGYWEEHSATTWDSYTTKWNWEILQGALPDAWAGQSALTSAWGKHDPIAPEKEGCIT